MSNILYTFDKRNMITRRVLIEKYDKAFKVMANAPYTVLLENGLRTIETIKIPLIVRNYNEYDLPIGYHFLEDYAERYRVVENPNTWYGRIDSIFKIDCEKVKE